MMESPFADTDERALDPQQPHGTSKRRTTTTRKAIIAGALVALLVGAVSGLAAARLTDRQPDIEEQRAENTRLASQVSQLEAQAVQLAGQVNGLQEELAQSAGQAGQGSDAVSRLTAEIAAMKEHVGALEAEKARLEGQLSQFLNPGLGPTPTALLTAKWVHRLYQGETTTVVCVEIENTSDSDVSISYSYTQFSAVDGENLVYPPRLYSPPSMRVAFPLMDGQLNPGEKRRGQLLYDVPSKALLTKLAWSAGLGDTPEIAVALPAEVFLVVDNVLPGPDANDC